MKAALNLALFCAVLYAVIWAALHAAGTDWSIPFALAIVFVAGVLLRKTP